MAKVSIDVVPQFLIVLEKKIAKAMVKWLRETCSHDEWSLTACSFVANAQVPEGYKARVQYSALTFKDDGMAMVFKLKFYEDAMMFSEYQNGIRKTLVPKKGYQFSDDPNIDIWFAAKT
jgi:hypothetical protein